MIGAPARTRMTKAARSPTPASELYRRMASGYEALERELIDRIPEAGFTADDERSLVGRFLARTGDARTTTGPKPR